MQNLERQTLSEQVGLWVIGGSVVCFFARDVFSVSKKVYKYVQKDLAY